MTLLFFLRPSLLPCSVAMVKVERKFVRIPNSGATSFATDKTETPSLSVINML